LQIQLGRIRRLGLEDELSPAYYSLLHQEGLKSQDYFVGLLQMSPQGLKRIYKSFGQASRQLEALGCGAHDRLSKLLDVAR
jgi:hypothetical protein